MLMIKPRRPRSVTILAAGVLTIAGMALLRLVSVIQQWPYLAGLSGYSPFYIAGSGLIWSAAGGALFWGLWRGTAWAPHLARLTVPLYAGYYWFDCLFMSNRRADSLINIPANAGFALLFTLLSLIFCFWALVRKTSITYFGERHERTS